MTFAQLSVICLVALAGPLLAYPRGWHLPVVLGELIAGALLGRTGIGYLPASDETFTFLADIGFALVMFVAGTHVPVRDPKMRPALGSGLVRALLVAAVAVALGIGIADVTHVHHAPLFAVLIASSSAALILPIIDSLGLAGADVVGLLPQIAIADSACIVALPLVVDPGHALRAAGGAVAVIAAAAVVFVVLRTAERTGLRAKVHRASEERREQVAPELTAIDRRVAMLEGLLDFDPLLLRQPLEFTGTQVPITLHAAMVEVLKIAPQRMMRAGDLAAAIERRGLYKMRDGRPVEAQQIHARVGHYPSQGSKEGTFIKLK